MKLSLKFIICIFIFLLEIINSGYACTRVLYASPNNKYIITGRNMDWFEPLDESIWVLPRGIKHDGGVKKNSLTWTSKYGSVVIVGYNEAVGDGLNEKGLAVNVLYLAETNFGKRDRTRPGLSWAGYAQYLLDNFATVSQAVNAMKHSNIQIVASPIPGPTPKPPTIHFSLSDATGDSAIFEYIKGKLKIFHGKQYKVMTNSPIYSKQLVLNTYWREIGGNNMLPGTIRGADRYIRASYYLNHLPPPTNNANAIINVISVLNNAAQPFTNRVDSNRPNLSSTLWQTVANNTNLTYYFHSLKMRGAIWLDLKTLNFKSSARILCLPLYNNPNLSGDIANKLIPCQLFKFSVLK